MKRLLFPALAMLAVMGGTTRVAAQPGWFPLISGTPADLNAVYFIDAETGYVVGDGGLIMRSIDGGITWATQPSGVTEDLNDLYFFTMDMEVY